MIIFLIYKVATILPSITRKQFPFTLNQNLFKTADSNSNILLNNLIEQNKIVCADKAFIKRLMIENALIIVYSTFKYFPKIFYTYII
ncbi:hypothetical protein MXB_3336 [Myxobolus squamalis]|nr:hypothetical protein MXB_3336 [Myxobolus squamalis]